MAATAGRRQTLHHTIGIVISRHCIFTKPSRFPFSKISADSIFRNLHPRELAIGSAESLQNLWSRKTTWLQLTCAICVSEAITFTRAQTRGKTSCGVWKRGRTSCASGRWVTHLTVALFSLDRVHTYQSTLAA